MHGTCYLQLSILLEKQKFTVHILDETSGSRKWVILGQGSASDTSSANCKIKVRLGRIIL